MYCLQNVRRCTCSFFHWPLAEGMPKDASKSLASVAADQLMARRIPVGSAVVLWVELLPAEVSEVLSALQSEMLPAQGVRKVQRAPPAENIERSGPSGQVLPVAALAEPALPVLRACTARPEGPVLPPCVLLRPVMFRVSALALTTISELCWMSVSSGYLDRSVQARRVTYHSGYTVHRSCYCKKLSYTIFDPSTNLETWSSGSAEWSASASTTEPNNANL